MTVRCVSDSMIATNFSAVETNHTTRGVNSVTVGVNTRRLAHFHTTIAAYAKIGIDINSKNR